MAEESQRELQGVFRPVATHYLAQPSAELGAGTKVQCAGEPDKEGLVQVKVLPELPGAPAGPDAKVSAGALREIPKSIKWLPLESNPEVFNAFARSVGLTGGWEFNDVFGLDEELLAMVPQPCAALVLLHPGSHRVPVLAERRRELLASAGPPPAAEGLFYMRQHDEAGNACGTIAAIHAIANARLPLAADSALERFLRPHLAPQPAGEKPALLGWQLLEQEGLFSASDGAADGGQTSVPDRDDGVDFHFVAFVNVGGRLFDIDGRKPHPLDCGPTSEETFLLDAAKQIREQYMALAPDDPNFSVVALCKSA